MSEQTRQWQVDDRVEFVRDISYMKEQGMCGRIISVEPSGVCHIKLLLNPDCTRYDGGEIVQAESKDLIPCHCPDAHNVW